MRAMIYTRYSSDNQREASLEDQERLCRDLALRHGWSVVKVFADRAMSGSSAFRPAYQELLRASGRGECDVVIAEALDRLSRDQEDVASLYKSLDFAGVKIVTHAEGEINELHVGLKGTMNALFLKDLALKTRRGLQGRIEAGKSAGGLCYGYRPVHTLSADGEVNRGERRIEESEAEVVRRIFRMFADGQSPIAIAKRLNAEGILGPRGNAWRDTTIRGHALRGTGILRNELYIGHLVWDRLHYKKDPSTGKRVSRLNAPEDVKRREIPDLRIVDDALWGKVQSRLASIRASNVAAIPNRTRFWEARRSQHLLTGKVFCGACGSSFVSAGRDYLACGAARKQGICDNTAGVRRSKLDRLILDGLRTQLMTPAHVAEFITAYTAEWNRLQAERSAQSSHHRRELEAIERKLSGLIDAIADGLRAPGLQQKLDELEARKRQLTDTVSKTPSAAPALHPNLAEVYRQKVADLSVALKARDNRAALEIARSLVERVTVYTHAEGKGLEVELTGALAAMIRFGAGMPDRPQRPADQDLFSSSVKVVAGARFELATFRL